MKSFVPLAALIGAVVARNGNEDVDVSKYVRPWVHYGEHEPVKAMQSWSAKSDAKKAALRGGNTAFWDVRQPENCHFPLEVVIMADATTSFQDNEQQMTQIQLPAMVAALEATHPGSKFAVVSFKDKPVLPFGEFDDYCWRFDASLDADVNKLVKAYANLSQSGGHDFPENQYGALLAALKTNKVGWSNPLASRLTVMATDAPPHEANDGMNTVGLPPFTGFDPVDPLEQCNTQYYPLVDEVKLAVEERGTYQATLVFDPTYADSLPLRAWQWYNRHIGQTDDFVDTMANDFSDFWVKLSLIIKRLEEIECPPLPSTTTTTTTTPATTTTTITTTTPVTTTTTATTMTTTPATTTTATTTPPTTTTATTTPATSTSTTTPPTTTAAPTTLTSATTSHCDCPPEDECACAPALELRVQELPAELHVDIKA